MHNATTSAKLVNHGLGEDPQQQHQHHDDSPPPLVSGFASFSAIADAIGLDVCSDFFTAEVSTEAATDAARGAAVEPAATLEVSRTPGEADSLTLLAGDLSATMERIGECGAEFKGASGCRDTGIWTGKGLEYRDVAEDMATWEAKAFGSKPPAEKKLETTVPAGARG